MMTNKLRLVQIAGMMLLVGVILLSGTAFAEDGGPVFKNTDKGEQSQDVEEYWTPERMKDAKPMPLPAVPTPQGTGDEVESGSQPDEPSEGAVPGADPGMVPSE